MNEREFSKYLYQLNADETRFLFKGESVILWLAVNSSGESFAAGDFAGSYDPIGNKVDKARSSLIERELLDDDYNFTELGADFMNTMNEYCNKPLPVPIVPDVSMKSKLSWGSRHGRGFKRIVKALLPFIPKNDIRIIQYVFADATGIVATDGYILGCVVFDTGLDAELYDPRSGLKVNNDAYNASTYPIYQNLLSGSKDYPLVYRGVRVPQVFAMMRAITKLRLDKNEYVTRYLRIKNALVNPWLFFRVLRGFHALGVDEFNIYVSEFTTNTSFDPVLLRASVNRFEFFALISRVKWEGNDNHMWDHAFNFNDMVAVDESEGFLGMI